MPSPDENFPHKNDRTFHQRCLSRARDEPAETPLASASCSPTSPTVAIYIQFEYLVHRYFGIKQNSSYHNGLKIGMEIDIICVVITWSIFVVPAYEILRKHQDYVYVNRKYESALQKQ